MEKRTNSSRTLTIYMCIVLCASVFFIATLLKKADSISQTNQDITIQLAQSRSDMSATSDAKEILLDQLKDAQDQAADAHLTIEEATARLDTLIAEVADLQSQADTEAQALSEGQDTMAHGKTVVESGLQAQASSDKKTIDAAQKQIDQELTALESTSFVPAITE